MNYSDKVVKVIANVIKIDWQMPYKISEAGIGSGSGFFIDKEHILTCAHVVCNAKEVLVEIPKYGEKKFKVDILGLSPQIDIALLKLKDSKKINITPIKIGDSSKVIPGDEVFAVGFPLGLAGVKITKGIISGRFMSMLQMDTSINPGNSGGPLIKDGKVVGINQGAITHVTNMNLAVPIDKLNLIKKELYKKNNLIKRPFIGAEYNNMDESLIKYLGSKCKNGIYVSRVYNGSPVDNAGIKEGDVICKIGKYKLDNYGLMNSYWKSEKMNISDMISTIPNNTTIPIEYWSSSKKLVKTKMKLTPFNLPIDIKFPLYEQIEFEIAAGMIVMELCANHIEQFENSIKLKKFLIPKNRTKKRLIVTKVLPGSYISEIGVVEDTDFIVEVNGIKVNDIKQYREALLKPINGKLLKFKTDDNSIFTIPLKNVLDEELLLSQTYGYPPLNVLMMKYKI
jgi:serine protease Do